MRYIRRFNAPTSIVEKMARYHLRAHVIFVIKNQFEFDVKLFSLGGQIIKLVCRQGFNKKKKDESNI